MVSFRVWCSLPSRPDHRVAMFGKQNQLRHVPFDPARYRIERKRLAAFAFDRLYRIHARVELDALRHQATDQRGIRVIFA